MSLFQSAGQIARHLIAAFAVAALATGCSTSADDLVPDKDMTGVSISGVGHYGANIGVPNFSLNGRWGGNSFGWGGGGGGMCCVLLPRKITKPVLVNVKWQTCDVGGIVYVNNRRVDPDAECKLEEHEATVPVQFEVQPGEGGAGLFVHFLPGNRVELWYPRGYPESSSYPGPKYPFGPAPDYAPLPSDGPQPTTKIK